MLTVAEYERIYILQAVKLRKAVIMSCILKMGTEDCMDHQAGILIRTFQFPCLNPLFHPFWNPPLLYDWPIN